MQRAIIYIFFVLSYTPFALSKDFKQQINQERQSLRDEFLKYSTQVQHCKREVDSLSSRVSEIKKEISENRDFFRFVDTEADFQKCLGLRKKSFSDINDIKRSVLELKDMCPFFSSTIIMEKIEQTIELLKDDLWSLNYDGNWIDSRRSIGLEVYNEDRLGHCSIVIMTPGIRIIAWPALYDMDRAYTEGDLFAVRKGLSALTVLSDYVSTMFNTCDVEGAKQMIESGKLGDAGVRLNQHTISILTRENTDAQRRKEAGISKYGDLSFEKASETICKSLKDKEKDIAGICESPLDNPSWLYSASYFNNQETNNQVTNNEEANNQVTNSKETEIMR